MGALSSIGEEEGSEPILSRAFFAVVDQMYVKNLLPDLPLAEFSAAFSAISNGAINTYLILKKINKLINYYITMGRKQIPSEKFNKHISKLQKSFSH